MKRILLLTLVGVVLVIALIGIITSTRKSSAQQALNDYKVKLRAQGEKLSWAESGYPRPVESNDCLTRIVQAVRQISGGKLTPGLIKLMDVSMPTNIQTAGAKPCLELNDKTTTNLSWEVVSQEMTAAASPLAEIRAALSNPPPRLLVDPTNSSAQSQSQYMMQRKVAQWLSVEIIYALHQMRLDLVRDDLQALQQLIYLHEDDPELINQMIRVAIAGLALADTWEALQATGWSEPDLAALQAGWERFNLLRNLETGLLGERLSSEAMFDWFEHMSTRAQVQQMNTTFAAFGASPRKKLEYYWQVFVTTPIWQMNREADELLALRHHQNSIESVRRLSHGTNWVVIKQELAGYKAELDKTLAGPLAAIRYSLSAMLIPNTEKAVLAAARNETLRRLAVVAIALKRYELRNRQAPPSLEALAPDFIAKIPIDPMSGKPLCYRTNQTGYVLYSVGEDGMDDGGDARAATPTGKNDLWSGRDAVWPTVTSNNP